MFCPECGVEYRKGFTECADCRVALVDQKPAEPGAGTEPGLKTIPIWESGDPALVAAARQLLDEAGIPYWVTGEESAVLYGSPCVLQAPVERAREARDLLRQIDEASIPAGAGGQAQAGQAIEFEAMLDSCGCIAVPPEIVREIPEGAGLRVVLMWDPPEGAESEI